MMDERGQAWDCGCDHEDADLDILSGRMHCACGATWHASEAEIKRHHELMARPYPDEESQ
jgi:hypothetical protein